MNTNKLDKLYEKAIGIMEEQEKNKKREREIETRLWKIEKLCELNLIRSPNGLFWKKCPQCNYKLKKEDGHYPLNYYYCTNCDYEWVFSNYIGD